MKLLLTFINIAIVCLFFGGTIIAQNYDLVIITGIHSGNESNNTLFSVTSSTIPSLAYIRAQKIEGPQNGFFTQSEDNIRYTSISKVVGMPENKSRIRFSFLQSDMRSPIHLGNFRFIINDIDGPSNESLATNCYAGVRFMGTSKRTNLIIDNQPPNLSAIGSVDENEGATSRVMFEFQNVSVIEFDNYANMGYFKDFDLNDDYPISKPIYVKCKKKEKLSFKKDSVIIPLKSEFRSIRGQLMVNINPIYFDLDESFIRLDAAIELEKVVRIMLKYPKLKVNLCSHTDSRALDTYNGKLSDKRAKSSLKWIIDKGIDPSRISGKGYGETKLVNKCSNGVRCTEAEHQLNRRTEFVILNPEVVNQ